MEILLSTAFGVWIMITALVYRSFTDGHEDNSTKK